jgi:uncharacterized protein YbjT (DUF2867 family)
VPTTVTVSDSFVGSYEDPAALRRSFEGAGQVLLVSTNDPHADAAALHAASPDSLFAAAPGHAATEQLLAGSGAAWTALRNGFYAHSLAWLLGPWRETGMIAAPADGPVSWTDRADAAETAAVILAAGQPFDGPVTLTTRRAVTFEDIAACASDVTGRAVKRVVVEDEQWVASKVQDGTPEPMARMLLGFFRAARAQCFAEVSRALAERLGREPRSVTDQLADTNAA